MLFQVWLSHDGPEKRHFPSAPALQDNTRTVKPMTFTSEISKKPYFSVTDQIFKNEYQFVFGNERITVHLPKILLTKQEQKSIEAMMSNKDVKKCPIASNLVNALETFSKLYFEVPPSGSNAWGVIPRKFKPLEISIVEDGTVSTAGLGGGQYEPADGFSSPKILLEKAALLKSPFEISETFTHEGSHWFYDALLKTSPKNGKTEKAMIDLRDEFIQMSSDMRITPDDLYKLSFAGNSKSTEHDSAPMFAFFDESVYNNIWMAGHPYDNPSELFASASTVLSSYPQEFYSNLAKFIEEKPDAVRFLFETAANVLLLHSEYSRKDFSIIPKETMFFEKSFASYMEFSKNPGNINALSKISYAFQNEFSGRSLDDGKLSALLDITKYSKNSELYSDIIFENDLPWQAYWRMSYLLENHRDDFMKNVAKLDKKQQAAIMQAVSVIKPEALGKKVYSKSMR